MSLQQIKEILHNPDCTAAARLEAKLEEINCEISSLRQQQNFIIEFLQNRELLKRVGIIPKEALVELFKSAGVDENGQWKFHNQFESKFPERHEAFLQLLGLRPDQVKSIREWSRQEQDY